MSNYPIDITADDPSSTSSGLSQQAQDQLIRQSLQQNHSLQNQVYGQSIVSSQSQEIFQDRVSEAADADSKRFRELEARDYERVQDALQDALHFVYKEGGRRDDYVWFVHPDTFRTLRNLYRLFIDSNSTGIGAQKNFEMFGVQFLEAVYVPEGWMLLAEKDKIKSEGPARPHPMTLIHEIDAGYPEEIEIAVGGEIQMRVINA